MLPPLRIVRHGLRRTTEALAAELARPGGAAPAWNELEWRLATAVAVAHGVSPLLCGCCSWENLPWRRFLESQREHVELRHRRIDALLQRIDADARAAGLALVPLKGAALHALGIYAPGERPMADIDLLVREDDAAAAIQLLLQLGYVESFAQWKHRVFKPATGQPFAGLGEHRDTPVNIELHTHIRERLPVSMVDISARIQPRTPQPGLNPYPSNGALMSHLLLHAAGNMCGRSLRLLHLHDIALLAAHMAAGDWDALWDGDAAEPPWWALPPLQLVARHYPEVIPAAVPARDRPQQRGAVAFGTVAARVCRDRVVAFPPRSRALPQESREPPGRSAPGARRHGAHPALAAGARLGHLAASPARPDLAYPAGAADGHLVRGTCGIGAPRSTEEQEAHPGHFEIGSEATCIPESNTTNSCWPRRGTWRCAASSRRWR